MSKARDLADGKFDTDTFVVDAANNRVGVGTSSPNEKLVSSGTVRALGATISNESSTTISYNSGVGGVEVRGPDLSTRGSLNLYQAASNGSLGQTALHINSSGNVGIGTSSPQTKFTVQGPTTANNIEISGEWIQSFNRGGSPGYQVLPIYASAVTMPLQPAFVAYNAPVYLTNNTVIVWSSTALNRGSVYNTSNGRFTAPVAGLYQFFASVRIESGEGASTYHRVVFRHNGSDVQWSKSQLSSRTTTGYYTHASNDQMISLSAGDYVEVRFESSTNQFTTSARDEHIFYGYLIG